MTELSPIADPEPIPVKSRSSLGIVLIVLCAGFGLLVLVVPVALFVFGAAVWSYSSVPAPAAPVANIPAPVAEDSASANGEAVEPEVALPGNLIVKEPEAAPPGMVWIPGGSFTMGNEKSMGIEESKIKDEKPAHRVILDGYWMDETEVTNAQFVEFVTATGYVTVAEKKPKREDFIDQVPDLSQIPEKNLVAGSICFNENFDRKALTKDHPNWPYQVWHYVKGANWRQPTGPKSSIKDRMDHPVIHVCWFDVVAYCEWAGKRLPTEAEWEYAARGGLQGKTYPWGDERNPEGKWLNNIWQGEFPYENKNTDTFLTTSPVKSFPANGYGLYEMSGNVWEWCGDWYMPDYYSYTSARNPQGPDESFDPNEPGLPKRVQRGGSFLCNANYCIGYRVSARMKGTPDSGLFHTGFRCVMTPAMREKSGGK